MTKQTQIPLTERQATALSRLLSEAISDIGSNAKARVYREVLQLLDAAVFLEE